MPPVLKQQEVPLDSPESCNFFQPSPDRPFVATQAALREYQQEAIIRGLLVLQEQTRRFNGID